MVSYTSISFLNCFNEHGSFNNSFIELCKSWLIDIHEKQNVVHGCHGVVLNIRDKRITCPSNHDEKRIVYNFSSQILISDKFHELPVVRNTFTLKKAI